MAVNNNIDSTQQSPTLQLSNMPDEVKLHILDYLPAEDLVSMEKTSKEFYSLVAGEERYVEQLTAKRNQHLPSVVQTINQSANEAERNAFSSQHLIPKISSNPEAVAKEATHIEDRETRDFALSAAAYKLGQTSTIKGLAAAELIDDPREKAQTLHELTLTLVNDEKLEEALFVAQKIDPKVFAGTVRDSALAEVALAQVFDDGEGAKATARQIQDTGKRERMLADIDFALSEIEE
ncbi:MAG: F-box protein [Chlamydiia bacterium]|nr:F-box protein [Chlamydiia bacterium]